MSYGMNFDAGIPSNYQTNLYWQYLMQTMQQAQQMQNAAAIFSANNTATQTTQQNNNEAKTQTTTDTVSVTSQNKQQATTDNDGNDDGKISAGKKFKNFFKGVENFFKGMVCDENGKFSITRTLTTAAVIAGAAALTVATGGAATPFLIAGGTAIGAIQTGKGIYKAATAKTDTEAEAAWQEIGSGTTAVVGSIAGAKGALKSAGIQAPKGNAITSALKATKDCAEIAGTGIYNGGKYAFTHSPIKTAKAIQGYYQNTAKANLSNAFSYKNAYKNYMENKKHITNRKEKLETYEKQITDVEAKLQDTTLSNAEKTKLSNIRENLYKAYQNEEAHFKANYNKNIQNKESYIEKLKETLEKTPEKQKTALQEEIIKLNEEILNVMKSQKEIEFAQYNIERANTAITKLKLNLKKANITEAETETINARIAKIESAIAKDKAILRNSNFKIAAQNTLPQVGIAYGTFYLSNPSAQVNTTETPSELDKANDYAKSQGFESANAMQEYLKQMQNANINNAGMTIPLPTFNYDSGVDFNALYQSPYPQYYF